MNYSRYYINLIIIKFFEKLGYKISIKRKNGKSIFFKNMYAGYPIESLSQKKFYNIGAGSFSHKYWTNLDYSSKIYEKEQKSSFVKYDIMSKQPLPIKNDEAELIYISHVVEHVTNEAVNNLFLECFRVLKPGGIIRILTPDLDSLYEQYINSILSISKGKMEYLLSI